MAAHDQLKQLFQVQGLEQRLSQLDRTRKTAPETERVRELKVRAQQLRQLQAALEKRITAARRRVRARELNLATAEEARQTAKQQLYGGEITSPRELMQLEKRLEELQSQVETEEAALLQALEALESLEVNKSKVDAAEAKNHSQLKVAEERLEHLQSTWDLEEAMLRDELDELRAAIDPEILSLYDRKKGNTGGRPIAEVRRGVCGGCRMTLPASVTGLRGAVLSTCEQCGRLLYWPD